MESNNVSAVCSVGRLVVGIFAIVLFALIMFQSCAAGLGDALKENTSSISGAAGLLLSIFMLVGGIVGIATRKSTKIGGCIASGVVFLIASLMGAMAWNSDYGDLKIWVFVALAFGIFYLICAFMQKRATKTETE